MGSARTAAPRRDPRRLVARRGPRRWQRAGSASPRAGPAGAAL